MKRIGIVGFFLIMLSKTFYAQHSKLQGDSLLFEKVLDKNRIQRLWIYADGRYLLSHYEKVKIGIDTGRIVEKGKKIQLISTSATGIDKHLRPDVLYATKSGWAVNKSAFNNRKSDMWLRVNDHTQHWRINPVNKDSLCDTNYYKNGKRMLYRRVTAQMKAKREEELRKKIEAEQAALQKKKEEEIVIKEYKEAYIDLTESVLPEYATLLKNHYCGPGCFESVSGAFVYHQGMDTVFSWNVNNSEAQRLNHFNVTIHETIHRSMYEKRMKCNEQHLPNCDSITFMNKYVILNSKREFIECDYENLPKAQEMKAYIPQAFLEPTIKGQDLFQVTEYKSPRLPMYVFNNTSANAASLYGMLNEFSAYYHGVNATWLLYKRADTLFSKMQYEDLKFVIECTVAYYEFSLFVAWYLDYLKHEHPQQFAIVLGNRKLRAVFTDLEFAFNKLTTEIEQAITQIDIINLYNKEHLASISDGLKTELGNSQALLNEFRIQGKQSIASR